VDVDMPIPELELARVKGALDKFCDRIPMHVRADLTNLYRFKGNSVILIERRPDFRDRTRHTEHEVAKFVYSQRLGAWSLRWRDRNGRWHAYDGFQDVPHFRDVLAEVSSDPTGIFFG
jgi:hypothetical protein